MVTSPHKRYVDFKKPPVVEVVCGVLFQPVPGLTTARIGQLWGHFGAEYTKTEDALPLPVPMEVSAPGVVRFPMTSSPDFPRVWFITEDGYRVIQVQTGRLHFNWRRQDGKESYPEFPAIIGQFKKYHQTLVKFLADEGLPPLIHREFEITYVNLIPVDSEWHGLREVGKVLPDLAWREGDRFLPNPDHLAWETKFRMDEGAGVLEVKALSTRMRDTGIPALLLEITARGPARPDLDGWFDIGHRSIVKGFADLTGESIQSKIWERMEDPS